MGSFSHDDFELACKSSSAPSAACVSEKSPYLMSVLSVLSEPFVLAGFALTLDLTLESALLSAVFPLPSPDSSFLTLLTSFLGTLRKAMSVPLSLCSRLASIPAVASSGNTSLMRLHSHRADLGHALSRAMDMPISSATLSSFLCSSDDVPTYSSFSCINLMMVCATGDPSRVAWFCTCTILSQSERNV